LSRGHGPTKRLPQSMEGEKLDRRWFEDGLGHARELSDRVTELSTLVGVSTLLSSDRPLSEVMELVCQLSAEICKAQLSFIHLADGEDDLVCVARYAPTDSLERTWEGIARIYGRKSIQKGEAVSRSNLVLNGEETSQPQTSSRIGGICVVPLKGKARTVGTMTVGYVGAHRFSAREKDMLNAVAAQLAMAVERSWLFDRLQSELARANSLREVATHIGANLELDAVLDSIVNHASRLLAAEFSAIFLVDKPCADVSQTEGRGGPRDRLHGCTVQLDDGPLGKAVRQAVETGRPAIAQSLVPNPGLKPPDEIKPRDYQVALAVPLLSRQEVLGTLAICYLEKRRFDASDFSLAEDFAAQAALAIRNARLYEDAMENRLSLEAAIDQINNHGISLLDEKLNIRFANPATYWLLGISPRRGAVPLDQWTALLKKALVGKPNVDRMIERIRSNPEQTLSVKLKVRGTADSTKAIRLLSLPLRQSDGSVHGRVNVLEESS